MCYPRSKWDFFIEMLKEIYGLVEYCLSKRYNRDMGFRLGEKTYGKGSRTE